MKAIEYRAVVRFGFRGLLIRASERFGEPLGSDPAEELLRPLIGNGLPAEYAPGGKYAEYVRLVELHRVSPLHEVMDEDKYERLTDAMTQHGWQGRPLLVELPEDFHQDWPENLNQYWAWTGSHRLAVWERVFDGTDVAPLVPVVIIPLDLVARIAQREGINLDETFAIGPLLIDDSDKMTALSECAETDEDWAAAALMESENADEDEEK